MFCNKGLCQWEIYIIWRKSRALQKPLRLGHSHASMAATLALHGFAGRRLSPAVGVCGRSDGAGTSPPYQQKLLFKGVKLRVFTKFIPLTLIFLIKKDLFPIRFIKIRG